MPHSERFTVWHKGELPCEAEGCREEAYFTVELPEGDKHLCFDHMAPHRDAGAQVFCVMREAGHAVNAEG